MCEQESIDAMLKRKVMVLEWDGPWPASHICLQNYYSTVKTAFKLPNILLVMVKLQKQS